MFGLEFFAGIGEVWAFPSSSGGSLIVSAARTALTMKPPQPGALTRTADTTRATLRSLL